MISAPSLHSDSKLILRGIHLGLTPAMKAAIEAKSSRLFRHEPQIIRLRIDVEPTPAAGVRSFTARGHVEISGADLLASIATEDAYKSVDLLMDKLDRMLRRRA